MKEHLYITNQDEYGKEYQAHLLEQYKLYVQMADKISERRQTANAFFLSVNTIILTSLSALISAKLEIDHKPLIAAISLSGIFLSYYWFRLIRSYKDMNSGKFKVIHLLESKLPSSPYDAEWEALGKGLDPSLYLPFTHIEMNIPWVFIILYLFTLVMLLF